MGIPVNAIQVASTSNAKQLSYAPGARIRVRDEEWMVQRSHPIGHGDFAIHCVGISELVNGYEAVFLTNLERGKIEPLRVDTTELVVDSSVQFRRSKLYMESMLRRTPLAGNHIAIGNQAAMKLSPFQLVPAAQALAAHRPRILIADGVGLGKTLEVGVLLAELIARGRGDRILVVVMKSMLAQFQKELWTRFTIPMVRLDSIGLKRVHYKIPTGKNPFHYYKRAIISIDTLKNERQYRAWLEKCHWDAVIIDECHNVVNASTERNKVAKTLSITTDALIFTSATPHNGKPESFATLMNLLEPTAVADPHHYGPEDVKGLYVRRFKKDVEREVAEHFPERDLKVVWCSATPAEEALFTALGNATFHTLNRRVKLTALGRARDMLFKTGLVKALLSSPQALKETVQVRINKLESRLSALKQPATPPGQEPLEPKPADDEEIDTPQVDKASIRADLLALQEIQLLAEKVGITHFSKLKYLL